MSAYANNRELIRQIYNAKDYQVSRRKKKKCLATKMKVMHQKKYDAHLWKRWQFAEHETTSQLLHCIYYLT